jgi:predicted aminopeptidase
LYLDLTARKSKRLGGKVKKIGRRNLIICTLVTEYEKMKRVGWAGYVAHERWSLDIYT